jgi:hypothetical protein
MEIDKQLRADFRRLLREHGLTTLETDLLLAVLLRALAVWVKTSTSRLPRALPSLRRCRSHSESYPHRLHRSSQRIWMTRQCGPVQR